MLFQREALEELDLQRRRRRRLLPLLITATSTGTGTAALHLLLLWCHYCYCCWCCDRGRGRGQAPLPLHHHRRHSHRHHCLRHHLHHTATISTQPDCLSVRVFRDLWASQNAGNQSCRHPTATAAETSNPALARNCRRWLLISWVTFSGLRPENRQILGVPPKLEGLGFGFRGFRV